jgi:hypothetical protein
LFDMLFRLIYEIATSVTFQNSFSIWFLIILHVEKQLFPEIKLSDG